MPSFRTGVVTTVLAVRTGLQRVEVDGEPAYVLTELVGPVAVGDRVVVNTTAVELGLGTGGWHVVHWNLARDAWSRPGPGHVMKLRYTSLQADTGAAEEAPGYAPPDHLDSTPVVACALHSQVAGVAAGFDHAAPGRRLVYVMTDSGALPLALSDLVANLTSAGLLASTVTAGQAFGGAYEAVNLRSALLVARGVAAADAIVVAAGPGVVGTGSGIGFTPIEVADIVHAAANLGGRPIVAARWSDADERPRHAGLSHHTTTALGFALVPAEVPVPAGGAQLGDGELGPHRVVEVDVPDVGAILAARGVPVTTMGRGPDGDSGFFAFAAAAGVAAAAGR